MPYPLRNRRIVLPPLVTNNSSGPALTPPVTSGLVLQLDANQGTSTTTPGAALSSWTDVVGSIAFSQGTGANQPSYQSNVYNGLPCIRFGGSHWLAASGVVSAINTSSFTIFLVGLSSSGTNQRAFGNSSTAGNLGFSLGTEGSPAWTLRTGTGSGATLTGPGSGGVSTLAMIIGEEDNAGSGNIPGSKNQGLYINSATLSASNTAAYSAQSTLAPTVGTASSAVGSNNWTGDICEILVYNRALTNSEVASLRTSYAMTKWGTP